MAYAPNDDLARALELLTIFRIWEIAATEGVVDGPAPSRDGLVKSPFRDDGHKGSFSICHAGKGFKDFGGGGEHGNAWKFAGLCWPRLSKGELAKKLIDLAGIAPAAPVVGATAVDPRLAKAAQALDRRDRLRAAEDRVYIEREKALQPSVEFARALAWPDFVRERFEEGVTALKESPRRVDELAAARGWPVEWVWELLERGLLSYPWERWAVPGDRYARRQKAFRIDAPKLAEEGSVDLEAIGYHQRWYKSAQGDSPAEKGWLYVPSLPKQEPRNDFERALQDYAAARGVTVEDRKPLVPPVPFVIGDLLHPRLVVILEGQWDAITFFGACGWFHDTSPADGVIVFGIRGVQGIDAFLSWWGPRYLKKRKPAAWVIAQNDTAGQSWVNPPAAESGRIQMPGFADRLAVAGCRRVYLSWLKPGKWGKDFNDYFRAERPSPAAMWRWMDREGVAAELGVIA